MDKADKEKLTRHLSSLVAKTSWNQALETALVENKVFGRTLLDLILVGNALSRLRVKFIQGSRNLKRWFISRVLSSAQAKQNGERLQKFYLDVQKRGPKAFDGLIRSLVASGNYEAAAILDPTVKSQQRTTSSIQARTE